MVEDNLLVSKTISETLVNKTMILSLENVQSFGKMYLEAVRSFQELETNINENRRFWMYNVAICNNMNKFSLMFQVKFWSSCFITYNPTFRKHCQTGLVTSVILRMIQQ